MYKATQHPVRRAEERGLKKLYDAAISVYTDGQLAEQVFDSPPDAYYIPHHHVMKPASTTKVGVVMNASFARRDQKSLNDCLFKGVSEQNPADALSRGLLLAELLKHPLWSHGADPLQLNDPNSKLYCTSSKPIVPLSKSESLLDAGETPKARRQSVHDRPLLEACRFLYLLF